MFNTYHHLVNEHFVKLSQTILGIDVGVSGKNLIFGHAISLIIFYLNTKIIRIHKNHSILNVLQLGGCKISYDGAIFVLIPLREL